MVTADKILIAVGTRPHRPSHIPFNGDTLIEPRATILDFMDRELIDNLIYPMHDRLRTRSRTSPWSTL